MKNNKSIPYDNTYNVPQQLYALYINVTSYTGSTSHYQNQIDNWKQA